MAWLSPEERKQFEDYLINPDVKYSEAFGQEYPEHEENFKETGVFPDDRPYPLAMIIFNPTFFVFSLFSVIIFYKLKKGLLKKNKIKNPQNPYK